MVNKAILVGRLGRDPETRFTGTGKAVCNFTVATDESYKDKSGAQQSKTEWHRVVVWGSQGEACQKALHKGSLVYVEGRLQTRQWDDKKTGQKKSTTEINAERVRFLDAKKEAKPAAESQDGWGDEDVPF